MVRKILEVKKVSKNIIVLCSIMCLDDVPRHSGDAYALSNDCNASPRVPVIVLKTNKCFFGDSFSMFFHGVIFSHPVF